MKYVINSSTIVHENVDNEVVIIHFGSGNYYSLLGPAALLWEELTRKACSSQLLSSLLCKIYRIQEKQAESDVDAFIKQLQAEDLIVESDSEGQGEEIAETIARVTDTSSSSASDSREYVAPTVDVYSDMKETIKLDPVHDVGATGWPTKDNESKE